MAFNFVANAAAITSLVSVAAEAGGRGSKVASQTGMRTLAIKDIKDLTGDSYLSAPSEKHNAMKKWVRETDLLSGFYKAGGSIKGFCSGVVDTLQRNIPTIGFSALTLASRNRTIKTIGLVGTAVSMLADFFMNGTNLFTKRNLIEK